jgi:hypothetical protein
MENIFSIIFLKSGLEDLNECHKILRYHKITAKSVETMPEYYHFTINKHTNERVKVYILTEYAYLLVKGDGDNSTKEENEGEFSEYKENEATIDDIIQDTLDCYIDLKTTIYKRNVLKSIQNKDLA